MKNIFLLFFVLITQVSFAQLPAQSHPYSTQSEEGFTPCRDTISILSKHKSYDIGLMLPTWLPIVDKNYIAVIEGKIAYNPVTGEGGPHVSDDDLPFNHFSHDMCFEIIPDKTDDNRFSRLLAYRLYNRPSANRDSPGGYDTVLQYAIHGEWETGLGMGNPLNPLSADNDAGRSGGFFSAGHELGDVIWNWPTTGDWVHVEGSYVWDRGHPPAKAELHPPRFIAVKRALPGQIIIGDSSLKFAMRVDLFASGDGGAIQNNRFNTPLYVKRVNMSNKDYEVTVKMDLPRPSPKAHLRYTLIRRKGDDYSAYELVELNDDSASVHITIPWKTKNANDIEIYARTLNVYWDEGSGTAPDAPVDIYKVKLTDLHFRYLNDILTKAEPRMFANVGNDWIFINDFFAKKGKILSRGLGKTYKHNWNLNNEFIVCVPRGKSFRVYMDGWEVDGLDRLFGMLIDPYSPCNHKTKHFIKSRSFSLPVILAGCLDDPYGETVRLHNYDNLGKTDHFTNSPQHGKNNDPCPFSKYPLKDRVFLSYTIEKVN